MKTGLERIADKARCERDGSFSSLLHHLTPELVEKHLHKMKINTAAGIDRVSLEEAKENCRSWIDEEIQSIHRKGYRAPPVRRVYIPKPGSTKERPLGIPTVKDRAIQGAVSEILSQIYEVDFLKQSFGGRPKLSAHHAVINLVGSVTRIRAKYILNCDLEDFFGSINHEWTMQFLSHRVKDPRILNLILRWLRAGVIENHEFQKTTEGVPQGGPISVLLSNLYLHYSVDLWLDKVVRPKINGRIEFVRYLDDFVILFERKEDLENVEPALYRRLNKFSLKINQSKTKVLKFGKEMATQHDTLNYVGFTLYRTKNRKGGYKIGIKTERSRLHRAMNKAKDLIRSGRHLQIPLQHKRINRFLRGHMNYYGIGDNQSSIAAVRLDIFYYWRKQLCRRSQKGKYTWDRYFKMLTYFPLCKIKIRIPYRDYASYVVL